MFLCRAWPARKDAEKNRCDLVIDQSISVWFSEVSLRVDTDLRVAIDRGLASSRVGNVLVAPAMLEKLLTDRGIASNKPSALLRRSLLIPVMHGLTFEQLDQVGPTLATRGGFSTDENLS